MATKDPYERDSDKEYTALEADRIPDPRPDRRRPRDVIDPAVDATLLATDNADDPEQAYPSPEQSGEREEELREMLRASINRDPEALAAEQARRHSPEPEADLPPGARRLFDGTPEMPDDTFDTEDVMDAAEAQSDRG